MSKRCSRGFLALLLFVVGALFYSHDRPSTTFNAHSVSNRADTVSSPRSKINGIGGTVGDNVLPATNGSGLPTKVSALDRKIDAGKDDAIDPPEVEESVLKAPISFYNDTKGCYLVPPLDFLGCGYDGHVYSATIKCPWGSRKVVAKMLTTMVNASDPRGPRKYVTDFFSVNPTARESLTKLHDILVANATQSRAEEIKNQLNFGLGSAYVPRPMLYSGMDAANRHPDVQNRYNGIANATDPSELSRPVEAKVVAFTPGKQMAGWQLSIEMRRSFARSLIHIYKYLFERGVMHCDMSMAHVYFDVAIHQATIIDFERYKLIPQRVGSFPSEDAANKARWQQLQLLSVLGNVCKDSKGKGFPMFSSCSRRWKGNIKESELVRMLDPILQNCGNFGALDTSMGALNDTKEYYENLVAWATH